MLDAFTFPVMFIIVAATIFLLVKLGRLPGKIACDRNHPRADAIGACGWLGLATLGLLWPFALVLSFTKPTMIASLAAHVSRKGMRCCFSLVLGGKVGMPIERNGLSV